MGRPPLDLRGSRLETDLRNICSNQSQCYVRAYHFTRISMISLSVTNSISPSSPHRRISIQAPLRSLYAHLLAFSFVLILTLSLPSSH
jgi:hypothetical protein